MKVTAELSCTKQPEVTRLRTEWDNNLDSMLAFLGAAHSGVKVTEKMTMTALTLCLQRLTALTFCVAKTLALYIDGLNQAIIFNWYE